MARDILDVAAALEPGTWLDGGGGCGSFIFNFGRLRPCGPPLESGAGLPPDDVVEVA